MIDYDIANARLTRGLVASHCIFGLAFITTVSRVLTRRFVIRQFGLDDYLIVFATLVGITSVAFHQLMIDAMRPWIGFRFSKRGLSTDTATRIFTTEYITAILYTIEVASIKFSLLAFYHRLLPVRSYQYILYATAGFVGAFSVATGLATVFQCERMHEALKLHYEGSGLGTSCKVNTLQLQRSIGIFSLLTDVVLLVLPIRIVYNLHASTKRKIALALVFLVGGIGTIATAVRVSVIVKLQSRGLSVAYISEWLLSIADIVWLSFVEMNLGIMCANFPAVASLWNSMRTRYKSSKASSRPSDRQEYDLEQARRRAPRNIMTTDITKHEEDPPPNVSQEHLFMPPMSPTSMQSSIPPKTTSTVEQYQVEPNIDVGRTYYPYPDPPKTPSPPMLPLASHYDQGHHRSRTPD